MSAQKDEMSEPDAQLLAQELERARLWGWEIHDNRIPGAARDLAWTLVSHARSYQPERIGDANLSELVGAVQVARAIAKLIKQADAFEPQCVREKAA